MLHAFGLTGALAGGAAAVFAFQPFGHRTWAFAAIFAALVLLAPRLRRPPLSEAVALDERRNSWRVGRTIRLAIVAGLASWLCLIAWSAFSTGGPMPPPKSDPVAIRILTWNILLGADTGPPWGRHGWPVRRDALRDVVLAAAPDIFCVQEALDGQVRFLESVLPCHHREGVGRDDGRTGGEYCAIYYDAGRFERLDGGTFWLAEPANQPPVRPGLAPKRVCTWVRLRDRPSGRTLRIYNAHLYLTERARVIAARIILSRIASGDVLDEVLLIGDFNASPDAPSRSLFAAAGLTPTAESSGGPRDTPTYQFYGIRWPSLDEIYASGGWQIVRRRIVDTKPENTFPSDHFGVLADLILRR